MWTVLMRLSLSLVFLNGSLLYAQCLNLAKGELLVDVEQCKVVETPKDFNRQFDPKFFAQMTKQDQQTLLSGYRGRIYKALVVESSAVAEGHSVQKGVLKGKEIVFFERQNECASITKKRLRLQMDQACCDGGIDAPCLLSTSYVVVKSETIGVAGGSAGDTQRQAAEDKPEWQAAKKAFQQKKFRDVIKFLGQEKNLPTVELKFMLALSYRQADQCEKAVPWLEQIEADFKSGKVFADQKKWGEEADFLRARCYARLGKPELAIVILDGYLVDVRKYRKRIRDSLRHKDFGWINASKEYQRYRQQATEALSK
jgi:hypothetical protein